MKLLHIDSSILGQASASRQLSAAIVDGLVQTLPGLDVARRDLAADPTPHLNGRLLPTVRPGLPAAGATTAEAAQSAAILQEFLDADIVVIGAPMYNFTVSTQLKAWLDRVLVAGRTFSYAETGPVGLAGAKRVIIASSRGGLYGPGTPAETNDFHETYLRAVFRFIGIDDIEIVRAEGLALGPDHREAAIAAALATIPVVVAAFAPAIAA